MDPNLDQLRLATSADTRELTSLIEASVHTLHAIYYSPKQMEGALGSIFCVDPQLIEDETFFVIERAGQIIGCGGWSFRRSSFGATGAPSPRRNPATDAAVIRAFFILPGFERQGLGTRLLKACEESARAAGFSSAEMCATLAGVHLYEAHGYKVTSECQLDLPNGEVLPVKYMARSLV